MGFMSLFGDGGSYYLVRSDGHEELAHPSVKNRNDVPREVSIKFNIFKARWIV